MEGEGGSKRKVEVYYDPDSQKFKKKSNYYKMRSSSAEQSQVSLSRNVSPLAVLFLFVSSLHVIFLAYNSTKSCKDSIIIVLNEFVYRCLLIRPTMKEDRRIQQKTSWK